VADQGPSQRRGAENDGNSVIGQSSSLGPKSASGEAYQGDVLGPLSGHDIGPSIYRGYIDALVPAAFSGGFETSGDKSRSQGQFNFFPSGHDLPSNGAHAKEPLFTFIGVYSPAIIEQPGRGTSYVGPSFSAPSALQQPVSIYYKLVAYDANNPTVPVRWVSLEVSFANAPAPPSGGTLVNLSVEGFWTQ